MSELTELGENLKTDHFNLDFGKSSFIQGTYIYWLFHSLLAQGNKRDTTKPADIWQKKGNILEGLTCLKTLLSLGVPSWYNYFV